MKGFMPKGIDSGFSPKQADTRLKGMPRLRKKTLGMRMKSVKPKFGTFIGSKPGRA